MTFAKKKKKNLSFRNKTPTSTKMQLCALSYPRLKKKGLKNPICPIIEGVNDSLMGGKIGISTFLSFCSIR